ncbi:MAG: hypothetical protein WDA11_00885 [Thiohalomonadaceae bacterium]
MEKYREGLIETQRRLNESYDKLVVTLAGGALALSVAFLKDVVQFSDVVYPKLLITSWMLFVLSLAGILGEILFGIEAHKTAIKQIDAGTIHNGKVGGKFSRLSTYLHRTSAAALLIGLMLLSIFAYLNTGEGDVREETPAEAATKPATGTKAESQAGPSPSNGGLPRTAELGTTAPAAAKEIGANNRLEPTSGTLPRPSSAQPER